MTDTGGDSIKDESGGAVFADWPTRAPGHLIGDRQTGFQIVFLQSVLDEIHLRGQAAAATETTGVLLGTCWRDGHGAYVLVERAIQPAPEMRACERDGLRAVGCFRAARSGAGVELCDADRLLCADIEDRPWRCAFIYSPHSGEEACFDWSRGHARREDYLIESNVTPAAARVPLISKRSAMTAPGGSIGRRRWYWGLVAVGVLAALIALWTARG